MMEIGTLFAVFYYVVIQQGDEIKNQGLCTFLKQQVRKLMNIFPFSYFIF